MESRIRVLIVDDHTVVRGGLRLFMMAFPDLQLVGEATEGKEAINLCSVYKPNVVLMDLMMPGMGGVETTRQIRERYPQIQVVALTSFPEENLVHDAIQAGAIGYMLKTATANELANAIRAAARGIATLSPEAETAMAHKKVETSYHQNLTDREWQIFRLVITGMNNSDIASELVIGISTVKYHVSNILSKLGVANRSEAIAYAIQHHLTD